MILSSIAIALSKRILQTAELLPILPNWMNIQISKTFKARIVIEIPQSFCKFPGLYLVPPSAPQLPFEG